MQDYLKAVRYCSTISLRYGSTVSVVVVSKFLELLLDANLSISSLPEMKKYYILESEEKEDGNIGIVEISLMVAAEAISAVPSNVSDVDFKLLHQSVEKVYFFI